MTLADTIKISGRFLRSVRIDKDASNASLDGFVFPSSMKELLLSMGQLQSSSGQGAFTWTGPYGSGKSSLALVMSQLLSSNEKSRKHAKSYIDDDSFVEQLQRQFPPKKQGWKFLNIIGELDAPHKVIERHLVRADWVAPGTLKSETDVVEALSSIASDKSKSSGGLFIIIDEMGKFLENSATSTRDIYFFQLLAEEASRSNGRLVLIGILHQAFQEYANKFAKEVRDEWAKIQGRYSDIPVNISGEEQIELISKAIISGAPPKSMVRLAQKIGALVRQSKPSFGQAADTALSKVWPLNPMTALMLGPISRRSYGQNQRSLFSFLSSAEGYGFQEFLNKTSDTTSLFSPAHLWNYLRHNLQSSIAVSADSHHFSNALEAIDRCIASDGSKIEVDILKCIALLELTRQQTGIGASHEAIELCLPNKTKKILKASLDSLTEKSLIVFKQYRGSYGIFEGSDFDIEAAIEEAQREVSSIELTAITNTLAVSMISAKRHYHETGTMRWCDFAIIPADQLIPTMKTFNQTFQGFGLVTLVLPTNDESLSEVEDLIKKSQELATSFDILAATSPSTHQLVLLAKEHTILSHIIEHRREIDRDKIARREIRDRIEAVTNRIEHEVWKALDTASWFLSGFNKQQVSWPQVNSIVSDLADNRFPLAPRLFNELLNRAKPSGSANGALKLLLHAMVLRGDQEQLGFEKFPAEKGLFCSLLESNGLHRRGKKEWLFVPPQEKDSSNLYPLWDATRTYLSERSNRSVSLEELYNLWRNKPFGVRDGVMPLLAVLFLITERSRLAYYREEIFLSSFTEIDVDYLLKAPALIDFRWMNMSGLSRKLLSNMADVASELTGRPVLNLEPLDVARALIAAFEGAAPWVHRTSRLSKNAIQIRTLFKRSNDPNKFLFDDIPALYANKVDIATEKGVEYVTKHIRDGLSEILTRYPEMLRKLGDQILAELQVPSGSPQAITELNERAKNIKGITGDMRLEAFIGRLTHFDNSDDSIEKLAGLGVNKPAKNWVDSDVDRAAIALLNFAQDFNKSETVARVKGRTDKRESMAVVVGMDGRPVPVIREFDIIESEKEKVSQLVNELRKILDIYKGNSQNVTLAALATVSALVIGDQEKADKDVEERDHA